MRPYLILVIMLLLVYLFLRRAAAIHTAQLASAQTSAYTAQQSAMLTPPPGADFPQARVVPEYPGYGGA